MDWELVSQQVIRHVEECLPQHDRLSAHDGGKSAVTQPSTSGDLSHPSSRGKSWSEQSRDELRPCSTPRQGIPSPAHDQAETWVPLARSSTSQAVPRSHTLGYNVSQILGELTDGLHQTQAAVDSILRSQREDAAGRTLVEVSLTKLNEITSRVSLVERRTTEQDNDFAESRIMSIRAEGMISALQSRQIQLETNVREVRDTLAALDGRCASAESALHGAVSHGQVIETIRSVTGPLRAQLETRLSGLEKDALDINDSLGQASTNTRELSEKIAASVEKALAAEMQRSKTKIQQLTAWVEATMAKEGKAQERDLAELRGQADHLSRELQTAHHKCHRAETGVKELELTVESMGRRLAMGGADEIARVRREVQNSEGALIRRIEEVQASGLRRMDEISRDVLQEKENRTVGLKEVSEEISSYRASLLHPEQDSRGQTHQMYQIHDRLDRVERRVATAGDDNALTSSLFSIRTQMKHLQLQIQAAAHGVTIGVDQLPREGGQEGYQKPSPRPRAVAGDRIPPLSLQAPATALRLAQSSPPNRTPPNTAVEGCSKVSPGCAILGEADADENLNSIPKGPAAGVCRESPPSSIPVENSGPNLSHPVSQPVAGRIVANLKSTETTAPPAAHACRDCGDGSTDIDVAESDHAPMDERVFVGPLEREIGSNGGIANDKGNATTPGSTVGHDSLPVENGIQAKSPLPADVKIKQGAKEGVPQTSPKASMEHLRKSALAAVSLSVDQESASGGDVERSDHVDRSPESRRSSPAAVAGSEPSSSLCAPAGSSSLSSRLLSSPNRFLPEKGVEDHEVNEAKIEIDGAPAPPDTGPAAADPMPSEAKRSIPARNLNLSRANPSSETRASIGIGGTDEKTGGVGGRGGGGHGAGTLATQMAVAVAPRKGLETDHVDVDLDIDVERKSDNSSFSVSVSKEDDDDDEDEDEDEQEEEEGDKDGAGETPTGTGNSFSESAKSSKNPHWEGSASAASSVAGEKLVAHKEREATSGTQRASATPPPPPPPPPSKTSSWETSRKSLEGYSTGPSPVSFRERSGSKDSGLATAQCEFCLRRYLKAAMSTHLQGCELRLVRCPFQCGVKVLVRNLEKHKKSCSMRPPGNQEEDADSGASSSCLPLTEKYATAPPDQEKEQEKEQEKGDPACDGRNVEGRAPSVGQGPGPGPGDPNRTVTCMRCQESMPFLLVPSHGAKCKGKKENGLHLGATTAAPPVASEKQGLSSTLPVKSAEGEPNTSATAAERKLPRAIDVEVASHSYSSVKRSWTKGRSPLTSPRDDATSRAVPSRLGPGMPTPLSPPAVGNKGWQSPSRKGVSLAPEVKVSLSPSTSTSRSKDVRTWSTRQVTSWLRDIMRPPKANVISMFQDRGVDGLTLLGMTDRYLLHPTEGMGITDEAPRRQILEALDSLKG